MKTKLTIEESQRLIELGVDPKLASDAAIYCVEPYEPYDKIEVTTPIFTLTDVLSLVPTETDPNDYWGVVVPCSIYLTATNCVWEVSYYGTCHVSRKAPELIDTLYELLCWMIENGHFKPKTAEK